MTTLLVLLAVICTLVGIIGAIVPGLPGPPVAWAALLLLSFTPFSGDLSANLLIVTAALAVVITVLDYLVPAWGTRRFGGTKAGTRGSTLGLILSVFILPWMGIAIGPFGIVGILLGPFVGAYLGEKWIGTSDRQALRSAWGSFVGFLAGTLMKLVYGIIVAILVVKDIVQGF